MKTILFSKFLVLFLLIFLLNSCTTDDLPQHDQTNADIIPTPPTPGNPVIIIGPRT